MESKISYPKLFLTFLKVGCTSFGPTTAVELKKNVVERLKWMEESDMMEGLAIAQTLPGPTFVLLSTYMGYRLKGILGAVLSMLGFILPSFILMTLLSWVYFTYQNITFVSVLFKGLSAVVVALILNAVFVIGQPVFKKNKLSIIIMAYALAMAYIYNNVFVILIGAALLGMLLLKTGPIPCVQKAGAGANRKIAFKEVSIIALCIIAFFIVISFNDVLFTLATIFFKIGLFAFGNAYTMLPLIQQEVVNVHQWLNVNQFLVGVALGQITPGPVSITSAFIGYKVMGVLGAMTSAIAVFSPALLLVVIVAPVFNKIRGNRFIQSALVGLNASFVGLMLSILINTGKTALIDVQTIVLAIGVFAAIRFTKLDTIWVILGGTALFLLSSLLI